MLVEDETGEGRAEIIATTRLPRRSHKRQGGLWSQAAFADWWSCYADKLEGAREKAEEGEGLCHVCSTFVGCFIFISLLGLLEEHLLPGLSAAYQVPLTLLTPSWGCAAIHVFSCWQHPAAQPRSVLLGNLLGGCAGLVKILPLNLETQAALAVAFTISVQELCGVVHPAGAANALIFLEAGSCTWPTFCCMCVSSSLMLVLVAVIFNNLCIDRLYPQAWWPSHASASGATDRAGTRSTPGVSFMADAPQQWLPIYLQKLQGATVPRPAAVTYAHTCFSSLSAFVYMMSLASLNAWLSWTPASLVGPAAACVSVFSDWKGANSQPWPCLVGSFLGALSGLLVLQAAPSVGMEDQKWLQAALAVAFTAAAQELTCAKFPAGGAIALAAVVVPEAGNLGLGFLLQPGVLSACMLVIYGTLLNNLQETRLYPRRWPWQKLDAAPPRSPPVGSRGQSERDLYRAWTAETESRSTDASHLKTYTGAAVVLSQMVFLSFLFFADLELDAETRGYKFDQSVGLSLLTFLGFGYMRAFLKAHGLGAVGFGMMVICLAMQWSMILECVLGNVLRIGLDSVVSGYLAAAAVLVSFGALVGKINLQQVLLLVLMELPCYSWTKVGLLKQNSKTQIVHDVGGAIEIHLFGALFGYAAARILGPSETDWLNHSSYSLDLLSFLGTLCFWVYFPSILPSQNQKAYVHIMLALCGSTVAAFATDTLCGGKLDMAVLRGAVLSGGVAVSAVADLVSPGSAITVGCVSSTVAALGLRFLSSRNIDTCGVLFSHGVPALLGGLLPTVLPDIVHDTGILPANQAFGLCGTAVIAVLSGMCCGYLLRHVGAVDHPELAFSDESAWACSQDIPRASVYL